jgi:Zn-dependent M28 family amino/carboxypeptidase
VGGHFDSRVSDVMNVRDSAPGANDDASGVAAVIEAARVLSGQRFHGSIVYAAFAGEESGLLGSQTLARTAEAEGWRLEAVLNNDIVGNTRGADGISDDRMVRVFSEGTPPTETDEQRRRRRFTGGEVDGHSRQLARYVKAVGETYFPELDIWLITG